MFGIGPTELIVVLVIVLLIFGPTQLPKLGRMLGQTTRALKDGMEDIKDVGDAIDPSKPRKKKDAASDDEEAEEEDAAEE